MSNRKRWKTKEEAREYISHAKNQGLSYCAACDFLGINISKESKELKQFQLGIFADVMISWSKKQLNEFIDQLKDETFIAEYVETHKYKDPDEMLATKEELIEVAKQELRERHGYERKQLRKRYQLLKSNPRTKKNRKSK